MAASRIYVAKNNVASNFLVDNTKKCKKLFPQAEKWVDSPELAQLAGAHQIYPNAGILWSCLCKNVAQLKDELFTAEDFKILLHTLAKRRTESNRETYAVRFDSCHVVQPEIVEWALEAEEGKLWWKSLKYARWFKSCGLLWSEPQVKELCSLLEQQRTNQPLHPVVEHAQEIGETISNGIASLTQSRLQEAEAEAEAEYLFPSTTNTNTTTTTTTTTTHNHNLDYNTTFVQDFVPTNFNPLPNQSQGFDQPNPFFGAPTSQDSGISLYDELFNFAEVNMPSSVVSVEYNVTDADNNFEIHKFSEATYVAIGSKRIGVIAPLSQKSAIMSGAALQQQGLELNAVVKNNIADHIMIDLDGNQVFEIGVQNSSRHKAWFMHHTKFLNVLLIRSLLKSRFPNLSFSVLCISRKIDKWCPQLTQAQKSGWVCLNDGQKPIGCDGNLGECMEMVCKHSTVLEAVSRCQQNHVQSGFDPESFDGADVVNFIAHHTVLVPANHFQNPLKSAVDTTHSHPWLLFLPPIWVAETAYFRNLRDVAGEQMVQVGMKLRLEGGANIAMFGLTCADRDLAVIHTWEQTLNLNRDSQVTSASDSLSDAFEVLSVDPTKLQQMPMVHHVAISQPPPQPQQQPQQQPQPQPQQPQPQPQQPQSQPQQQQPQPQPQPQQQPQPQPQPQLEKTEISDAIHAVWSQFEKTRAANGHTVQTFVDWATKNGFEFSYAAVFRAKDGSSVSVKKAKQVLDAINQFISFYEQAQPNTPETATTASTSSPAQTSTDLPTQSTPPSNKPATRRKTINKQKAECVICLESFDSRKGLFCGDSHFLCTTCFGSHVQNSSQREIRILVQDDGGVFCPRREAGDCSSPAFDQQQIANNVSKEVFDDYMKARERVVESRALTEHTTTINLQQNQRNSLDQAEQQIKDITEQIIDRVLVLCCPRCGAAFDSFDGCLALRCHNCACHFCALCQQDCGCNAHMHTVMCAYNPKPGEAFLDSTVVKEAQERNKRDKLQKTLKSITDDQVKAAVVENIRPHVPNVDELL